MSALTARRYFERGVEALRGRSFAEARQSFDAALELCAHFYEARVGSATALLRMGEAPRAVSLLRDRLAQTRDRTERSALLLSLCDALMQSGQVAAAERAMLEAIEQGADAAVHDQLARLRARSGRYGEAFDQLLAAAQRKAPRP